jgi:hypothetical protein
MKPVKTKTLFWLTLALNLLFAVYGSLQLSEPAESSNRNALIF